MRENSASSRSRLRQFDHGRLQIALSAALVLVGCAKELGSGQSGTAASSGTGQGVNGPGGSAGTTTAGTGATAGSGGKGGTGGTGGTAGAGASGGTGGFAGGGGLSGLPDCSTGMTSVRVCIVSNIDAQLGSAGTGWSAVRDSIKEAPAIVEAVGTGAAPTGCGGARVFGGSARTDWWIRVRTEDTKLWTIGLGGLGSVPLIQNGDAVKLDLEFRVVMEGPGLERSHGFVQLSDGAGTPLLWAGSSSLPWLSLTPGQPVCAFRSLLFGCPATRYEVVATINGSSANLAPFSTTLLEGYSLTVGEYNVQMPVTHTGCAYDAPPPFAAAAVKAP